MTVKPVVKTTTGAIVTLTIEIGSLGSWGPDCQIAQVYRQALVEAENRLAKAFKGDRNIRIVGVPNVRSITTDTAVKP
ncbi:hypothetical protein Rahaq_4975 (plasmid) [Rahnella aceris]|uniref:Uncharacterized protein n=1 Tax=Rahnella sp. (strain Y9602) TaxID=2703885 RepID=A0A0H3FIF3_RAHSY|nr:hypothetical protein [Rahnella aceris]ADW76550.1 hypothetical protein Rahaq_4975 [Rahnella aceris]